MKIKSLTAENFMSFQKLKLQFPDSGLFFVGGKVEDSAVSNSNRAGKSSIFEALCFGLFGSTVRKIKEKDDVVNWDAGKNCVVDILFTEKEVEYEVIRFRNDSTNGNDLHLLKNGDSITADTTHNTQVMIDDILGMNWMVFSTAVIFSDKARRFADAKDAEKKEIFDEILLLHQFQEAQTAVKIDIKDLKNKSSQTEINMQLVMNSIEEVRGILSTDKNALVEIEKNKVDAIKAIQAKEVEMSGKLATIKKLEDEKTKIEKAYSGLISEEGSYKKAFEDVHTEKSVKMKEMLGVAADKQAEGIQISKNLVKIKDWLSNPDKLPVGGENCPICRQPISEACEKEVKKYYVDEIAEYDKRFNVISLETDKANKMVREIEGGFTKRLEEIQKIRDEYDGQLKKLSDEITSAEINISKLKNDVELIEKDITLIRMASQEAEDIIQKRIKSSEAKIAQLQVDLSELEQKILHIRNELQYYEFWIEGFGNQGIKSFLLDTIVPELNNRVNYYSSSLMDNDIQIQFDTESTLKSGETRDKFNVKILIDDRVVNYESCSSGEKGRIDTAILLALQNLIFSRKAGDCSFVVFDEVFEHLDSVGIERTINLLNEEAKDKAIFLISHQQELADYFDNQIIVVRGKNGVSRLE